MSRLIAIGDIHGCHIELRKLLSKLDVNTSEDEIWSVGDAFDRAGKYCAMKVYETFQEFGIKYIYGNHDAELAYKVKNNHEIKKPWYKDWWDSFDEEARLWFLNAEKYYHIDNERKVLIVHAGVDPLIPIDKTDPRTLCTIQCICPRGMGKPYERLKRNGENIAYFWTKWLTYDLNNNYKDIKIVYGHTVHWPKDQSYRMQRFDKINVTAFNTDWGCVHKGQLACLVVEDNKTYFESVDSERDYYLENYQQS